MAKNATADGRTETKRFTETVRGDDLIEGDRIDKRLVARTPGQYGERVDPHMDSPETQLVAGTELDRYDDVHSAILADPDTQTLIRAGRHASNQAWSQQEADWTVRDVGTTVVVTEAEMERRPEAEQDESARDYMQTWVEVLFDDFARGRFDYADRRTLEGSTLTLDDEDGRKGYATIELGDD